MRSLAKISTKSLLVAVLLIGTTLSASAGPTLVADTLTATNVFDGSIFAGPTRVTVGDGPELLDFGGVWTIDFLTDSIRMMCTGQFCADGPFGMDDNYLFESIDIARVTGAVLDPASHVAPSVSFTDSSVSVFFGGDIDHFFDELVVINLQLEPAGPSLANDTLTVTNVFDGSIFGGPTDVIVDVGAELQDFGGVWTIDILANSIRMSCTGEFCADGPFGLQDDYLFEGIDAARVIGAELDLASDVAPNLSFTDSSVSVLFGGDIDHFPGEQVVINLQLAAIPIPAGFPLLASALAGLVGIQIRRRTYGRDYKKIT